MSTPQSSSDRDHEPIRVLISMGFRVMPRAKGGPGHMEGSLWAVSAEMEQQQ